jgi:hypothetical protein
MKYDFNHIDPRTGMPREAKRPEDDIQLMCLPPARSCNVTLLQNRVNLRSVGNIRLARTLYYDLHKQALYTAAGQFVAYWRGVTLNNGQRPAGWIETDIFSPRHTI